MRRALAFGVAFMVGLALTPESAVGQKRFRFVGGVEAEAVTGKSVLLSGQANKAGPVAAQVSANRRFTNIAKTRRTKAQRAREFAFEVRFRGLQPGRRYFFRFVNPKTGARSAVGRFRTEEFEFLGGVAAGEPRWVGPPMEGRVLLWGRANMAGRITAQVSRNIDGNFRKILATGTGRALKTNGFAFEIEACCVPRTGQGGGGRHKPYFFRFVHNKTGTLSEMGTFRFLPAGHLLSFVYSGDADTTLTDGDSFRDEVAQVMSSMRAEGRLHFFAWLGGTIHADSALRATPAAELEDYRQAYWDALQVPEIREMLAHTSVEAQWGDREVASGYSPADAGLDPDLTQAMVDAGRQAFLESFPVRERADGGTWRIFWATEGTVSVFVLDERTFRDPVTPVLQACGGDGPAGPDPAPTLPQILRDQLSSIDPRLGDPPPPGCRGALEDPDRTMLGARQKKALLEWLSSQPGVLKVILSETPIQQYYAFPYDRWEGFGAERWEILNHIRWEPNCRPSAFDGLWCGPPLSEEVFFASTGSQATMANVVCAQTFEETTGSYECNRDDSPWELVTGPIGASTYAEVVNDLMGSAGCPHGQPSCPSTGLAEFFRDDLLMPCVDLDQASYGKVDLDWAIPPLGANQAPFLTANSKAPTSTGSEALCEDDIVLWADGPYEVVGEDDPFGRLETASSPGAGLIRVSGWAIDPNAETSPVEILVYVKGPTGPPFVDWHYPGLANGYRADVAERYPDAGPNHGFDSTFETDRTGPLEVCVWARNIGPGMDDYRTLGCKHITVE